jgi:antirestriction protein ArdC
MSARHVKADIYQRITDQIVAELERGAALWLKPWSDSKARKADDTTKLVGLWPHNAITGRRYSGVNVLLLWGHLHHIGADTAAPLFLTYKQAQAAGGHVRKGEHGCQVIAFRDGVKTEEDEDTGEERTRRYMMAFGHTVFHVSQCDGLTLPKVKALAPAHGLDTDAAWQTFVNALGVDLRHGGERAFCDWSGDYVQMPTVDAFKHRDLYKAVALHEFTHWSGHKRRLARENLGHAFGSKHYAFEELVAELGAAFLCADHGVIHEELRHAGYIQSWIGVLKEDKRAIVRAASLACKAAEYIGDLGRRAVPISRAVVLYKPQLPAIVYPFPLANVAPTVAASEAPSTAGAMIREEPKTLARVRRRIRAEHNRQHANRPAWAHREHEKWQAIEYSRWLAARDGIEIGQSWKPILIMSAIPVSKRHGDTRIAGVAWYAGGAWNGRLPTWECLFPGTSQFMGAWSDEDLANGTATVQALELIPLRECRRAA